MFIENKRFVGVTPLCSLLNIYMLWCRFSIKKGGINTRVSNNARTTLRLQKDLKDGIKLLAKHNHISMNEQILEMLKYAYVNFLDSMKNNLNIRMKEVDNVDQESNI